jgi:hypothetical protein
VSRIQSARNSKLWPLIADAESTSTELDRLRELAEHPSEWVRGPVRDNPSTPDDAILKMIDDPRNEKWFWFEALQGRRDLEERLSNSPRDIVRVSVALTYWHGQVLLRGVSISL